MVLRIYGFSASKFFDSNYDKLCSIYPEFVALTQKIIPRDILGECGVGRYEDAHDKTVQRVTLIAAVCSSVMAATVLIVTLSSVCRGGKGKDEEVKPLERTVVTNTAAAAKELDDRKYEKNSGADSIVKIQNPPG